MSSANDKPGAPGPSAAGSGAKMQLSQREIEVVSKAWLCITSVKNGVPQVDARKLAQVGPYASADSARHVWKPIERKLVAMAAADSGGSAERSSPATTPRSGATPRKAKAATSRSEAASPSPAPRRPQSRDAAGYDDDDDDDKAASPILRKLKLRLREVPPSDSGGEGEI